jgi:hypothetical protein
MCIYRGSAWQFRVWGGYFTVCNYSTLLGTRHDSFCSPVGSLALLCFWRLMPKGGESRFRGSVDRGFRFLCVLHSCIMSTLSPCILWHVWLWNFYISCHLIGFSS